MGEKSNIEEYNENKKQLDAFAKEVKQCYHTDNKKRIHEIYIECKKLEVLQKALTTKIQKTLWDKLEKEKKEEINIEGNEFDELTHSELVDHLRRNGYNRKEAKAKAIQLHTYQK